ncbi:hypothetical protein [Terricaulis silvestris]|uniref:Integral membrane protein n=1 Tax=Terricaulis silvestris TaxID=2686094 RepID=A0A6I6MQ16_9CAUL|nr:hypothetical protein [Terricaulis silvestris]QGZ95488.1 hypothetical protein DSM104635_02337 [Terricaulis silvestris]
MNRTAVVLAAILIVVYAIEAAVAISHNQIVVGQNYWNAPLFALLQLVVVTVAAPTLLWYALRHWNDERPPRDRSD